ncbi:hypothetical protein TNCV_1374471 [Trichonephila clavipes]|nr:hypothetical protein TNCV_1374471 [Trichonephila clavipes]
MSQVEVACWIQMSGLGICSFWQQFQASVKITRRTGQGRSRVTAPVEDHYVALNAQHHRGMITRQLSQDLDSAAGEMTTR